MIKNALLSLIACCVLFSTNVQAELHDGQVLIDKNIIVLNDRDLEIDLDIAQLLAANDTSGRKTELKEEIIELDEDMEEMSHELQELIKTLRGMGDSKSANGAFLGILLESDQVADKGVMLIGVTPDGPAQHAGLQADDVILSINEQSLEGDNEHKPASKLHYLMRDVKPGEKLTLKIDRDGNEKLVELVAGKRADHLQFGLNFLADDLEKRLHKKMHVGIHHGPFAGIELYPMNKELGHYFGTGQGMLILNVTGNDKLELEAGDVIMKIGDRVPKSPSQTWRILQSYDSGETIKFTLMRQQKKILLSIVKS